MSKQGHGRRWATGFTLIELVIVIAIIGILTAIAMPAYSRYVWTSRRADARDALNQYQSALERCYAETFSYASTSSSCPGVPSTWPGAAANSGTLSLGNSPQGYYAISAENVATGTYTLTATAQGGQTADSSCQTFTVDQAGNRTSTDSKGGVSSCW